MFWDTIDLNEKSLTYRIQIFTFGNAPFAKVNYCPHFWLAVFCALVLPFTLSIKPIVWVVRTWVKYSDTFFEFLDREFFTPQWERRARNMSDRDVWSLWQAYQKIMNGGADFKREKDKFFWEAWTTSKKDWQAYIEKIREKMEAKEQKQAVKKEKREKRKKEILYGIVKYTKWFIPAIGIGILGGLGFGVYWLWDKIIAFFATYWLNTLAFIGVAVILIVVFVVMLYLFKETRLLRWLAVPFEALYDVIKLHFKVFKDNHCPGINWTGDKSA